MPLRVYIVIEDKKIRVILVENGINGILLKDEISSAEESNRCLYCKKG